MRARIPQPPRTVWQAAGALVQYAGQGLSVEAGHALGDTPTIPVDENWPDLGGFDVYDIVVRDGLVVDVTGMASRRADAGIRDGRIVRIGRIRERGREDIDAEGHVVAPGFIDGHTHMDAQVMGDPYGSCSCWHGVTTVVMGNCGFSLAPARTGERHFVVCNLERAGDSRRRAA
jgi:hypothetical protein